MNKAQRGVLAVGLAGMAAAAVYVPWRTPLSESGNIHQNMGYALIWRPPRLYEKLDWAEVALDRVLLTVGGIATITVGALSVATLARKADQ